MDETTGREEVLELIRERGYLCRLENTDAWWIATDRPPEDLPEAWDETAEIASGDARSLIDAGALKEQRRYSLDGGTLVIVFAPAHQGGGPSGGE
jgi:hypothetical protein